jgi:hypothetical protein
MHLRAATAEGRSTNLYALGMGLNPPEIHGQLLHTVGSGGIDLGVVISFSSPDWRLLDLFFEYSIDDGDSWRPLVRDSDSPQRSWSAVVYGVRSHETVRVRAVLGDEFGPETAFTVREGIEAATEYLRAFTPIGRRPHIAPAELPLAWCRRPSAMRSSRGSVPVACVAHRVTDQVCDRCCAGRGCMHGFLFRSRSESQVASVMVRRA